jgi:predicted cupin superfamily sugar epimerase
MTFFKQLFVLSLSALVILFSGGAQVASHFCNGKIVSKSFNLEITKCKKDKANVPLTQHPIASKSSCCKTEISFVKSSVSEKFEFQKDAFFPHQSLVSLKINEHPTSPTQSIKKLRSPPHGPSIHVWNAQFLI